MFKISKKILVNKIYFVIGLFLIGFTLTLSTGMQSTNTAYAQDTPIYFFYGQGCPHCSKVESYFNKINAYDSYPLVAKEVYFNRENAVLFTRLMDDAGIPADEQGVPTLVAGDKVITGDAPIISQFITVADTYVSTDQQGTAPPATQTNTSTKSSISLWVIVSASLVDAINPCAFAVLLILLTTVLAQKDNRKRIIASGLAFSLAVFASYLLMGLGVYTALASAGTTSLFTTIVGVLAIILGLFNLKDWLWYGKTAPMEVPMSWRPKMASIIERVTSPAGALLAGLIVSLFLLPCTSGPYIVVLGLLAESPMDMHLIWYLLIYNFVFILPMLAITFFVAFGLKVDTLAMLREQHIDKLHLIAGLLLIGIGIFVLWTL